MCPLLTSALVPFLSHLLSQHFPPHSSALHDSSSLLPSPFLCLSSPHQSFGRGAPRWPKGQDGEQGSTDPFPPDLPQHSDSQTCPFCRCEIKGWEAVSIYQFHGQATAEDSGNSSDQEGRELELGQVSRASRELESKFLRPEWGGTGAWTPGSEGGRAGVWTPGSEGGETGGLDSWV